MYGTQMLPLFLLLHMFNFQVKIGFTVKANNVGGGSIADLRKKNKGSISSLNKVRLGEIL
jgi:hypothetical protein